MYGTNPKTSVALLERLVALGFGNREFCVVHHFADAKLQDHVRYCGKTTAFQVDDTKTKVQARLELVLSAYERGGFKSEQSRQEVLLALSHAAVAEIPK